MVFIELFCAGSYDLHIYLNHFVNSFCRRKVKYRDVICSKAREPLSGFETSVFLCQKHTVFSFSIPGPLCMYCFPKVSPNWNIQGQGCCPQRNSSLV